MYGVIETPVNAAWAPPPPPPPPRAGTSVIRGSPSLSARTTASLDNAEPLLVPQDPQRRRAVGQAVRLGHGGCDAGIVDTRWAM